MEQIELRHRQNCERLHDYISNKLSNERQKYCISLNKYLEQKKEKEELKSQKAFQKYVKFYYTMKDKQDKQKEKIKKNNQKLLEIKERIAMIKKNNDKKSRSADKNMRKNNENNKTNLQYFKTTQLEKIIRERKELFEKNKIRKEEIAKMDELRRENILLEENNIFDRVYDMELDEYDRKQMIQKRNLDLIKDNFDLRKDFLKRLNLLQGESVTKKTDKQRRKIYTDKLKREAEIKKKEEEEKLEKMMAA